MGGAERVLVVGASGFGRECLDVLEAMIAAGDPIEVVGVLDDCPSEINLARLADRGVSYLGTITGWLAAGVADVRFVLGIGNPSVRRRLVETLEAAGLKPFNTVHPSALVGANTRLSQGIVICAGAVISTNVQIGQYVHVNPNATIGHDAVLRNFASVNPAATISGEVEIETGVLVGAAAVVLQGLSIGAHSVVGAGAVVTKSIPKEVTVKGNPGRWSEPE